MKQKSSKFRDTAVSNMTVEQAVDASTNIKIEAVKVNPRPKPKNPTELGSDISSLFHDIDYQIEEGSRDADMGRRVYEVEGRKYRIRQANPYALWEVVCDKGGGSLPNELQGRFTDLNALEKALASWSARLSSKGSINKAHRAKLEEAGFFDEVEG
jgi:hypothetical protein